MTYWTRHSAARPVGYTRIRVRPIRYRHTHPGHSSLIPLPAMVRPRHATVAPPWTIDMRFIRIGEVGSGSSWLLSSPLFLGVAGAGAFVG